MYIELAAVWFLMTVTVATFNVTHIFGGLCCAVGKIYYSSHWGIREWDQKEEISDLHTSKYNKTLWSMWA